MRVSPLIIRYARDGMIVSCESERDSCSRKDMVAPRFALGLVLLVQLALGHVFNQLLFLFVEHRLEVR
jgi:hypothetical protein